MDIVTIVLSETWGQIVLGTAIAVAGALLRYAQKLRKEKRLNSVGHQVGTTVEVSKLLVELRLNTSSARAYVAQLSNGVYYANKVSQLKLTCTHSSVRDGIADVVLNDSTLVSKLPNFFELLVSEGCFCLTYEDVEDIALLHLFEMQGVYMMVVAPFYGTRNDVQGFVGIDYLIDPTGDLDKEARCDIIKKYADRIGYTLKQ